jgi:hypothetical protein
VTIPAFDEPQQTVIKFVSDRECREKSNIKRLKGNVFCGSSQDDSVDECLGDTGGPVVVSDYFKQCRIARKQPRGTITRKNTQVITDLQSSCSKVVVKPISGCVRTVCSLLL